MTDWEKAIKGLEDIITFFETMSVIEDRCNELKQDAENAIAMLKEAQLLERIKRPVTLLDMYGDNYSKIVRCKDCIHGQYDAIAGGYWCNGKNHEGDWFCADGA